MMKDIAIATMILVAATLPALAQGGNPSPAPHSAQPPTVIGQTGTMYDGNNANLQLPPEQNAYWARLWAEPGATGNSGPASAVAPGGREFARRDPRRRRALIAAAILTRSPGSPPRRGPPGNVSGLT